MWQVKDSCKICDFFSPSGTNLAFCRNKTQSVIVLSAFQGEGLCSSRKLTTYRSNIADTTTLGQTRDNTPGSEETGRGSEPFKGRVALGPRLIVFQSWWPPLSSSWVLGGGKPGGKAFIPGCSGFFLNPSLHGSGWSLIHVTEH